MHIDWYTNQYTGEAMLKLRHETGKNLGDDRRNLYELRLAELPALLAEFKEQVAAIEIDDVRSVIEGGRLG